MQTMQRFLILFALFLTIAVIPDTAFAADPVLPQGLEPGSLLEQEKKLAPIAPKQQAPPVIKPEKATPGPEAPSALRVRVKEFRLEGAITRFTREELLGLLKDLIGKELTMGELQGAANRITAYYRDHGFFLASAVLPQQDVTEGVITIMIVEGVLEGDPKDGGVRINGTNLRLREDAARRIILEAVPHGKGISQADLERGLFILNDLPGISSSANLEAGTAAGTTRIVVDVNEAPLFGEYLMFDNYGNRYTGYYRATAGVTLNDPTRSGDQLSLSGNTSLDGDSWFMSAGYNRPIGYSGLVLGASFNYLQYKLGRELKALDNEGTANDLAFTAKYPLLRGRLASLFLNASYDYKRLDNSSFDVDISRKVVNVSGIGLSLYTSDNIGGGGFSQASFTYSYGDLDLGKVASNLDADRKTAQTDGIYRKLAFGASRNQRITNSISLGLNAAGQLAGKNLDSSEKFTLGGPAGVRAYPGSEATGDDGARWSADLRWNALSGTRAGDLQLISFYDAGIIRQFHELWQNSGLTTPNRYRLQAAGLGLVLGKPGRYDARLTYAHRVGTNPGLNSQRKDSEGLTSRDKLWFMLSAMF